MNTAKLMVLTLGLLLQTRGYGLWVPTGIVQKAIREFSLLIPSIRYVQYAQSDLSCKPGVQNFFLEAGTCIAVINAQLIACAAKNMLTPGGSCNTGSDLAYECLPLAMSEMSLYMLWLLSSGYQELTHKEHSTEKPNARHHTALWRSIGNAGSAISAASYGCLLGSIALWGATKIITTVKQI